MLALHLSGDWQQHPNLMIGKHPNTQNVNRHTSPTMCCDICKPLGSKVEDFRTCQQDPIATAGTHSQQDLLKVREEEKQGWGWRDRDLASPLQQCHWDFPFPPLKMYLPPQIHRSQAHGSSKRRQLQNGMRTEVWTWWQRADQATGWLPLTWWQQRVTAGVLQLGVTQRDTPQSWYPGQHQHALQKASAVWGKGLAGELVKGLKPPIAPWATWKCSLGGDVLNPQEFHRFYRQTPGRRPLTSRNRPQQYNLSARMHP